MFLSLVRIRDKGFFHLRKYLKKIKKSTRGTNLEKVNNETLQLFICPKPHVRNFSVSGLTPISAPTSALKTEKYVF